MIYPSAKTVSGEINLTGFNTLMLALAGMLLAALPASSVQAQGWNYSGSSAPTISNYVSAGGAVAMSPTQSPNVFLQLGNNATYYYGMDTGSTGILIDANHFTPGAGDVYRGQGTQTFDSSGIISHGELYETNVVIKNGTNSGNATAVATARVTILRVTSITCMPTFPSCTASSQTDGNLPVITYMGVGFDRTPVGTLEAEGGTPPLAANTALNPFINITSLASGSPVSTLSPGYIVSKTGVKLGLTPGNTSGFSFVKLKPNADGTGWLAAPVTITTTGPNPGDASTTNSGTILPDTGINWAYLTPAPGNSIPTTGVGCPNGGTCAAPGTVIKIYLPGQSATQPAYYTFTVGDGGATTPDSVSLNGNSTTGYINTGRAFFDGFDYLYDPVGGYIGYKSTGAAGVSVTPSTALIGDVPLPDGFASGMPIVLYGDTTLKTDTDGIATLSGVISDASGAEKLTIGSGQIALTGTNTYTGTTTVSDGATLQVDGSIAASSGVTVNNGGKLSGSGTVSATTIKAGGILAPGPGNATANLAVAGDLAFQSGALYLVHLDAGGGSSKAVVTGNVTLGGAGVKAVLAPGAYTIGQTFTILTSTGAINGTFGSTSVTGVSGFAANLNYADPTKVGLTLTAATTGIGSSLNTNQNNVATAINSFFNGGGTLPAGFVTLAGLSGSGLQSALKQTTGEIKTGSQKTGFNAMHQFMGVMTDPFIAGRSGFGQQGAGAVRLADAGSAVNAIAGGKAHGTDADAPYAMYAKALRPVEAPRWGAWGSGFAGRQTTDGDDTTGSNRTTSSISGTAVGVDYMLTPATMVGFALADGKTNFSVDRLGTGRSDLLQAGAFVRHTDGPLYVTTALAYGWQDVSTDRTVTIAGADHLRAEFNANTVSGRIESGYRMATPWFGGLGLTPYAAAQTNASILPAYAESAVSGNNTFALAYNSSTTTTTRSELGLYADKSFATPDGTITLRGRTAWAHDFNVNQSTNATFQALPGTNFVVNGATSAPDAALVTSAVEYKWPNGISLGGTFEGEFSDVTRSYAGKAVVRYAW